MLEGIREKITTLISLYEAEKQRGDALAEKLSQSEDSLAACKEQIADLERQIDNFKLGAAFGAGTDKIEAKERLTRLIAEIDRCIKLLQK